MSATQDVAFTVSLSVPVITNVTIDVALDVVVDFTDGADDRTSMILAISIDGGASYPNAFIARPTTSPCGVGGGSLGSFRGQTGYFKLAGGWQSGSSSIIGTYSAPFGPVAFPP